LYIGDGAEAVAAWLGLLKSSVREDCRAAADLLIQGRAPEAEQALRHKLSAAPDDADALLLLAETVGQLGRLREAEDFLVRALATEPDHAVARIARVEVLLRLASWSDALEAIDRLLASEPQHLRARILKATALGQLGDHAGAATLSGGLLEDFLDQPKAWLTHGHDLRTIGHADDAIAAYREAVVIDTGFGDAWWALANLKTYRFSAMEREQMAVELARTDLAPDDRISLNFALAKAEEDAGHYAEAFDHYRKGNAGHRARIDYDPDRIADIVERSEMLLTPAFFAERASWGAKSAEPIFIVGLPRAGSTLVDQILASHSEVESLGELPDVAALANWVGAAPQARPTNYPDALAALSTAQIGRLGQAYLDRTAPLRRLQRTHFIDKAPGNFLHIGLIFLMFPNARIIDVRRHPLDGCLSAFRQHFGAGWEFSYDLTELGRYYADYTRLMDHIDAVRPGAVYRMIYERLVQEPEGEIRRLLLDLGLPFEPECLKFYENTRPVPTPSSEQVRRPIFSDAMERWKHFDPWLGPLKAALGPALETRGEKP
jgi:tetratricopeptide (TPR) repeat protein